MKTIFKEGDTVYCCLYGEGVVEKVDHNSAFPIGVRFGEFNRAYTHDGSFYSDAYPTLSLTPYKLEGFSQERKIDWNEFIGEWGFFWDDNDKEKVLDVLEKYTTIKGASYPFSGLSSKYNYICFQPLTPELKQLLEQQGIINPSNSTPLK